MKTSLPLLGFVLLGVLTAGCTHLPRASKVQEMRQHPEYRDAMQCAPDFTTKVMKALADLEFKK